MFDRKTLFSTLFGLPEDELAQVIADKKAILFSPTHRQRNLMLGQFTKEVGATLFTVKPTQLFKPYESDQDFFKTFMELWIEDIQKVLPKFGSKTKNAILNLRTTPESMAEAFIADINKSGRNSLLFIIDEFDHVNDKRLYGEVVEFFRELVPELPNNAKVIINSRSARFDPWNDMVREGTAVVLGDYERQIYGGHLPVIDVLAFGSGQVHVDGQEILVWDGPLPRNLFYYFVDHPMVTRDEIFETFWPELNTKEATNVFHVTKRKISERLGYELTTYSGGFYRPSNDVRLLYDVRTFEDSYNAARAKQDTSTVEDWEKCIKLYRSEFLHELDMPWIKERRDTLRDMYTEALIATARLYREAKDLGQAASFFLRALDEQSLREDLYRDLMAIYHQQESYDKAVDLYKQLEDILYRKLKIKPSAKTNQLYNIILNEMP